jgi:hypothetical protein
VDGHNDRKGAITYLGQLVVQFLGRRPLRIRDIKVFPLDVTGVSQRRQIGDGVMPIGSGMVGSQGESSF